MNNRESLEVSDQAVTIERRVAHREEIRPYCTTEIVHRRDGKVIDVRRMHNLIPTIGHAAANGRISNQGGYSPFVNIALGIGATAAAAGDTALGSESTTVGAGRGAATATQVTTTVTNDTMQLVKTFTLTGTLAITEEGIFDSATASSGTLLARQVFSAINVVNGDQLTITHKVQT